MRINAFVTTAALACVLLAGCTDDPVGPVDGDTSAPTTSASPTPTGPTPPPLPDAAKADTADGAVAFVQYYIKLLNYAANTGDVAPLRSTSRNCTGCETYADGYEKIYAAGGNLNSPGWQPVSPIGRVEGDRVTVVTEVKAGAVTSVPSAGASPQLGSDATYSLRFQVERVGDAWRVVVFQGETV
ncbi:DUF6318 family protein [Solicola sp. PLA-1-18]|uniref:DUF6318 family protein n=1 Tax=Solicola sp. PLA-1-18 TaxID=3380532 RepID=UPI003B7D7226